MESTENETIDQKPEADQEVDRLLSITAAAQFFRSIEGRFHARVPVSGRQEILGLRSATFRDWLVGRYLKEHRKLPSQRSVGRVFQALEANARFDPTRPAVHVRVGFDPADDETVEYLDLADAGGHAVRMCASGWSVVDRPSVHFNRPQGLLPLPVPGRDGSIELLRPFVNLNDSDFLLLIAWMAAALRSTGPYPILVIHGEQGSAKSTLAKVVRQLIDPQTSPLLAEPRSTRDLMVTAVNGWLLAYDNVSALASWLSDSLCRLASGGGFAARALFSNDERNVIHAQRPIILNGIDEFVHKGDLADRAVFLHLPPIAPDLRREEAEFWRSFQELQPRILGGLLDAVVGALREYPSVQLAKLPRMADFARFGEALGRGMGWRPEAFLGAYLENRMHATVATLDDSVFGTFLLERLHYWDAGDSETKSPAEWLARFNQYKECKATTSARWPKTPGMLGNELRRLAPTLRENGVIVTFGKNRKSRLITITLLHGFDDDYSGATP
jgi:hypothetical protein